VHSSQAGRIGGSAGPASSSSGIAAATSPPRARCSEQTFGQLGERRVPPHHPQSLKCQCLLDRHPLRRVLAQGRQLGAIAGARMPAIPVCVFVRADPAHKHPASACIRPSYGPDGALESVVLQLPPSLVRRGGTRGAARRTDCASVHCVVRLEMPHERPVRVLKSLAQADRRLPT